MINPGYLVDTKLASCLAIRASGVRERQCIFFVFCLLLRMRDNGREQTQEKPHGIRMVLCIIGGDLRAQPERNTLKFQVDSACSRMFGTGKVAFFAAATFANYLLLQENIVPSIYSLGQTIFFVKDTTTPKTTKC